MTAIDQGSAVVTNADLEKVENDLVRAIQGQHFQEELANLRKNAVNQPNGRRELSMEKSKIRLLNPFVDASGTIRIGSRLVNSSINDAAKFPAILPRKDANVRDLIQQCHQTERHAGPKHVLTQLRQRK